MSRDFPEIVCLCGSTKFKLQFEQVTKQLTLNGKIILSVGCFPHADYAGSPEDTLGEDVKIQLDQLHFKKIELADSVFVINQGGYVGESTRNEIEYAKKLNKPINWLEPHHAY